jgi:hypothetical protein
VHTPASLALRRARSSSSSRQHPPALAVTPHYLALRAACRSRRQVHLRVGVTTGASFRRCSSRPASPRPRRLPGRLGTSCARTVGGHTHVQASLVEKPGTHEMPLEAALGVSAIAASQVLRKRNLQRCIPPHHSSTRPPDTTSNDTRSDQRRPARTPPAAARPQTRTGMADQTNTRGPAARCTRPLNTRSQRGPNTCTRRRPPTTSFQRSTAVPRTAGDSASRPAHR